MRTSLALSLALIVGGGLLLAGCGATKPSTVDPAYSGMPGPGAGGLFGDQGITFGTSKTARTGADTGGALGVNAFLWRGALDTLSFMPLASADPFGGVIITDWYQPAGSPDERFKATAYILGRELRSDGVRVAVFRQVMQNGQWVDAQVSPVTVGEIEGRVLARARELRAQALASG
jgi:Domain of unknown function (DUF3576)